MPRPVLVLLGGLPATGKSTVAAHLNHDAAFSYVRIDSIEQALRDSGEMGAQGVAGAGYQVGYAVSADLLRGGNDVLVECVNPLGLTRRAWRTVASACGALLLEVELCCSDASKHQQRAETREPTVPGLSLPSWQQIQERTYEPWPEADLRIDTAFTDPAAAATLIRQIMTAHTP